MGRRTFKLVVSRSDSIHSLLFFSKSNNSQKRRSKQNGTTCSGGLQLAPLKLSIKLLLLWGRLQGFHQNNIRCDCYVVFPQIYDTATGHKILTLHDSNNTNNYSKNLASFNPTDDLVLNDGVLWDVKGKRVIHKFDKFNNFVSGVFHPSGLEIIINSEIVSLKNYQSPTSLFLSITDPNG